MDRFMEQVAVKQKKLLSEITFYLANILMVGFGLLAAMDLAAVTSGNFTLVAIVETLVMAAIAFLLYFYRDRIRTEYEYTFTNGVLDFAQVFNNRKRKNLGSLNCKTVDSFGPVRSASFKRYSSMQGVKMINWFVNREAELYYFYFQKDGSKKMIVFEPNADLVEYIRFYVPRSNQTFLEGNKDA